MKCRNALCFHAFVHLAAGRADAQLGVVGLDLLVEDVVSSDLLLQVCHGGAELLCVHLFLLEKTHTKGRREKTGVYACVHKTTKGSAELPMT